MWYLQDMMDACIRQTVCRAFIIFFIGFLVGFFIGCETPYSGHLGPKDFNGWIESEEKGFVCLWNGFDRICVRTIPGPPGIDGKNGRDGVDGTDGKDGKDGKDGTDGQTLIAIREVPLEIIVEKIVEKVVVRTETIEVPKIVEKVVERIVEVEIPVEVEVPIEGFVVQTVEVIRDVCEGQIREVPVPQIVKEIEYIYRDREPISVTEGKIYTESGYNNPPSGFHSHTFTHTHDGATHTHRIIHPNGEQDDWGREHDGFSGLVHD